jgi:hypothetical protein
MVISSDNKMNIKILIYTTQELLHFRKMFVFINN